MIGARVVGSPGRWVAGGFLFSGVRAVRPPGRWVRIAAGPFGRRVPWVGGPVPAVPRQSDNDKCGGVRGPAARHNKAEAWFLHEAQPTPCPGALTVRLASVTWDNALGDFDVGADVGEHGQNFGLSTRMFEETQRRL